MQDKEIGTPEGEKTKDDEQREKQTIRLSGDPLCDVLTLSAIAILNEAVSQWLERYNHS